MAKWRSRHKGVYPRGRKLWIRFKDESGEWTQSPTPFYLEEEDKAAALLREVKSLILIGKAHQQSNEIGPVTVRQFSRGWLKERTELNLTDVDGDESKFRIYIFPDIGDMPLAEVRPRHLVALVKRLKTNTDLAPRSIHNVYSVIKALFRDAAEEGIVPSTPCILSKKRLGPAVDKDPEWRATAMFTHKELEVLIGDDRVPVDRRVFYALCGIGALRLGEAAGLRWRHVDPNHQPLGRLVVATTYDRGRTKSGQTRLMPVHPTLAGILAEWRLEGWPTMMGRLHTPDDLVIPYPASPRIKLGTMRDKNTSRKRWLKDLEALGLRHRRIHDLRRTMISRAVEDGARKDLLKLCTHGPPKREGIDAYITIGWKPLCREVSKLKVHRRNGGELVHLHPPADVSASEK